MLCQVYPNSLKQHKKCKKNDFFKQTKRTSVRAVLSKWLCRSSTSCASRAARRLMSLLLVCSLRFCVASCRKASCKAFTSALCRANEARSNGWAVASSWPDNPCRSSSMASDSCEMRTSFDLNPRPLRRLRGFRRPAESHMSTITSNGTALDSMGQSPVCI